MTDEKREERQREERQPKRINPVAIVAGALASLSAAVIASFFGVAGTLVGAAMASIVSSLAAALYSGLLVATHGWVRRAVPPRDRRGERTATSSEPEEPLDAGEPRDASGPPDASEPLDAGEPRDVRATRAAQQPGRGNRSPLRLGAWPVPRWLVIGGAAVVIFVLAIGTLTAVEAAIKEPIASALGVRDKGQARTSVGVAVRRASGGEGGGQGTRPAASTTTLPGAPPSTAPGPGQAPGPTSTTTPSATGGRVPPSTGPPSTSGVQPAPSTSTGAPGG